MKLIRKNYPACDGSEVYEMFCAEQPENGWYDLGDKFGLYAASLFVFRGEVYKYVGDYAAPDNFSLKRGEGKFRKEAWEQAQADLAEDRLDRLAGMVLPEPDGYRNR